MPRTARASVGGMCYHVLNRGNGRAEVFHKDGDYAAFVELMAEANERLPMRILGYCLMPNHFHLVLWPRGDGDLSRWMQWLLTVARAALPSPLPRQRPRLARTLQGVSDRAGRPPADRAAVRRTQSAAGEPGGAGRGVGLVEPGVAPDRQASRMLCDGPVPLPAQLARAGQPAADARRNWRRCGRASPAARPSATSAGRNARPSDLGLESTPPPARPTAQAPEK